ncbi:tetratricopeptide repeat protein [Candidatus Bipolaricaulota bacterium]|nr:tetratricopeptide repeat protein [Candidatus Bipolaricaulota bacterium]
MIPLLMWPGLTDYNYAKCIVGLIFISCLLVLWGWTAWRRPTWTIRVPWLLIPAVGLILAGALSLIQAADARVAIQSLVLLTYFVLLLWMIANVVRDERDVQWILGALLASALLAALYGALQYFGVVPGAPNATGVNAIVSCMGNRNHLGAILFYLFYPSIILLIGAKQPIGKAIIVVGICAMFAVMLLVKQTATRVALTLVTVALLIGSFVFRSTKPLRANRWWLIALAIAVLSMSLFTAIRSPMESPAELWENNSGTARAWFWLIGAEMLADHPAVGVGLGNYKVNFFPYKAEFATTERGRIFDFPILRVTQAHNDYVQTVAELGGLGLLMLLAILIVLGSSLWIRLRQNDERDRLDLLLLTGGILSFLAHSVVSFPAHVASSSLMLIVFCGLALSPRFGDTLTFRWTLTGWKAKSVHLGFIVISLIVSTFAMFDLRANWLMERGFDRIQAGLYASAELQLQQSLALDFAPRQTYYYLAIAQIQLGNLEQAEANLEQCMTTFSDDRVYLTYADVKMKRGKWDEAQAALDVLLATHPDSSVEQQARYIEAVISINQRQFDQAFQSLTALVLDYPTFEPGLVALGQLCAAQGLTGMARNYLESALNLIEASLDAAYGRLESTPVSEAKLIRDEIETLNGQRDHVIRQLGDLP